MIYCRPRLNMPLDIGAYQCGCVLFSSVSFIIKNIMNSLVNTKMHISNVRDTYSAAVARRKPTSNCNNLIKTHTRNTRQMRQVVVAYLFRDLEETLADGCKRIKNEVYKNLNDSAFRCELLLWSKGRHKAPRAIGVARSKHYRSKSYDAFPRCLCTFPA